jgi:hypothetical protein
MRIDKATGEPFVGIDLDYETQEEMTYWYMLKYQWYQKHPPNPITEPPEVWELEIVTEYLQSVGAI